MVRVAVISDTHGDLSRLDRARDLLGPVDWLIHAGDYYRDAQPVAERLGVPPERVRAVVGNCDYHLVEPALDLFEIEGVTVLLTHGHHYGVKHTLDRIYYKAREARVRVAVFGHSHVAVNAEDGGILLLNPGSLSQPRLAGDLPSCALLEVNGGLVTAKILSIGG
ncbi:MAG TPA: metallophosphoesterase [Symbiobacteriaceae bacterium]|nr:metallophosphoesterase [Symbiobacteriaceae bacterium]